MDNNFKNGMIAVLIVCILVMSIGYALFQQRLDISGTSSITSIWDVEIINIESQSNGEASNAVRPSFTPSTATFSANLVNPNDSITYDITIENKGTLDAELKLITNNSENNPAVSFIYAGATEGNILKAHNKTHVYVTVKYNDVTTQPEDINSNFKIILDYIQYIPRVYEDISTVSYLQEMSTSYGNWMNGAFRGTEMESLVFTDSKVVPEDAISSFDVSAQDNGEVMLWWFDEDSDGQKEVYVGQDGGVIANPNSSYLFYDLRNLEVLDLTHLDTHYVTDMSNMFKYTNAPGLDISRFDTSNVTTMKSMFSGLKGVTKLDISGFNTSNVTDMSNMFSSSSLEEIVIKGIDTSNVTDMNNMFNYIENIQTVDLTGLDTSSVTNMSDMFSQSGFTTLDLSGLNTSKVTDMSSMFMSDKNLVNLNVNIDTSSVTNMEAMFRQMSSIETLDLSSFNTSNVTNTMFMFYYSTALKTIYASDLWNMGAVTSSTYMFGNNTKLVGDNNYKFSSGRTSASYAKYNGQGYLTYKANN